jgi:hypothetical protein
LSKVIKNLLIHRRDGRIDCLERRYKGEAGIVAVRFLIDFIVK